MSPQSIRSRVRAVRTHLYLVPLVAFALLVMAGTLPAYAATGSVGVCHLTEHGHYEYSTVAKATADAHAAHDGDVVGEGVTAADCPGAAITPDAVRIDRGETSRPLVWAGRGVSFVDADGVAHVWTWARMFTR